MDFFRRYWTRKRPETLILLGFWPLLDFLRHEFGGDTRDRTADLLHAMQALSQLSYTPTRRR